VKVIVIGAGLLGVSSAFFLNRAGCEVTVIERNEACALEASYANGGLLTPSMSDPWNAPGIFWNLLRWLGREDSPFLLRPRALPTMIGWGLTFLRNSGRERFVSNTLKNLRLGNYNMGVLRALRAELKIEYLCDTGGTMKLFRDSASMEEAESSATLLSDNGVTVIPLDVDAVVEKEPALAPVADDLAGAHFFPDDETGDARQFTEALAACAREQGVSFRHDAEVTGVESTDNGVSVAIGSENLHADACVIAAGSYSLQVARMAGMNIPLRPVKGYSITLDPGDWQGPRTAIVDDSLHAGVTPLGSEIRVAGTAEFAGYDLNVTPGRIDNLFRALKRVYPECPEVSRDRVLAWAGLRPVCVDGVPLIGATKVPGVFLNTGHGHLGWTLAVGSGKALAHIMTGQECTLDMADYAPARFNKKAASWN